MAKLCLKNFKLLQLLHGRCTIVNRSKIDISSHKLLKFILKLNFICSEKLKVNYIENDNQFNEKENENTQQSEVLDVLNVFKHVHEVGAGCCSEIKNI